MSILRQLKDNLSAKVSHRANEQIELPKESTTYTLTPQDLMKSENAFIQTEREGKEGLVWTTDSRSKDAQLQRDVLGQVKINHKGMEELGFTSEDKLEIQKLSPKSEPIFNTYTKAEFGNDYDAIMKHYSQISVLVTAPFGTCFNPMQLAIQQPASSDISMDLYLEEGEVYFKAKAQNYAVSRQVEGDMQDAGHLPGYVEVVFKLDKDKGFALQHMSTNSELMRNLLMGEKVHEDSVINAANAQWREGIRKIEANLARREQQLDKWLSDSANFQDDKQNKRKKERKLENKGGIVMAREAIKEYKAGKMGIQEVHDVLSSILSASRPHGFISRFFPPVSGTAKVLKNVLADLERTTGYKPSPKVEVSTLNK